jgi:hypothetical protein
MARGNDWAHGFMIRAQLIPSVWMMGDEFDVFLSESAHIAKHKPKKQFIPNLVVRFGPLNRMLLRVQGLPWDC